MSEENLKELYLRFLNQKNYTEEMISFDKFKEIYATIMNANDYNTDTNTNINVPDNSENINNKDDDVLKTRYRFFKNEKDGKYYTIKHTFNRFDIPFDENQEGIRINGFLCFPIDENYVNQIINNSENSFSPYITITEEVNVDVNEDENEDSFYPPIVINQEQEQDQDADNKQKNNEGEKEDNKEDKDKDKDKDKEKDNGDDSYKPVEYPPAVIDQDEKGKDDNSQPIEYPPAIKQEIPEPPHVKPHVEQILAKLTNSLKIQKNDGKLYETSNINPSNILYADTHTGNWKYNLVGFTKGVLSTIGAFVAKHIASFQLSDQSRKNMKEIDARLHGKSEDTTKNLTDEELEVLWNEYKGSRLLQDNNGNTINPLIGRRLREYGLEKVAKLNNEIKQNYTYIYSLLKQINILETKIKTETNPTTKKAFEDQIKELYSKAADAVKNILDKRTEADNILDSGVHGILEDFKAVSSNMNYVGYRFRKKFDFNNELQDELGRTGQNINIALAYGNDENLVKSFMEHEKIYFDNTKIEHGFWQGGDYSAGEKYYTPLAQEFDYRDDPYITNMFTTIAVATALVSAGASIWAHHIEAKRFMGEKNKEIDLANNHNLAEAKHARNVGNNILGTSDKMEKGMQAQAHQDVLNIANTQERIDLDMTNWKFDHIYHIHDAASHKSWNALNSTFTNQIQTITNRLANKTINQTQALTEYTKVANNAQKSLNQVVSQGIAECQKYAAANPQHDLSGVIDSMRYIQQNPNAIVDMNNAIVSNMGQAAQLANIQASTVTNIAALPSDMWFTLVAAASSVAFANRVANAAKSQNYHRGYGNEITAMMEDYYNEQEEENTETHAKTA